MSNPNDSRKPRLIQHLLEFLIDAAIYAVGFFAPFMFFLAMESSSGDPVEAPEEW